MSDSPNAVCFDESEYAGPIRRIVAFLIDLFCYSMIYAGIVLSIQFAVVPRALLRNMHRTAEENKALQALVAPYVPMVVTLVLGSFLAYYFVLPTIFGLTPGKITTGTKLVDQNGGNPTVFRSLKRFLLGMLTCFFFGASYILCFKSDRRQAMHDRWSGTWVVRKHARPRPARLEFRHQLIGPFLLHYAGLSECPESAGTEGTGNAAADMPSA